MDAMMVMKRNHKSQKKSQDKEDNDKDGLIKSIMITYTQMSRNDQ